MNRWEASWKLVEKVNHPNLGLCLDTYIIIRPSLTLDFIFTASRTMSTIFPQSQATRSSLFSLQMLRCCVWNRYNTADTIATSPSKANSPLSTLLVHCTVPATKDHTLWKSSTMNFDPLHLPVSLLTDTVHYYSSKNNCTRIYYHQPPKSVA